MSDETFIPAYVREGRVVSGYYRRRQLLAQAAARNATARKLMFAALTRAEGGDSEARHILEALVSATDSEDPVGLSEALVRLRDWGRKTYPGAV